MTALVSLLFIAMIPIDCKIAKFFLYLLYYDFAAEKTIVASFEYNINLTSDATAAGALSTKTRTEDFCVFSLLRCFCSSLYSLQFSSSGTSALFCVV